MTSTDEARRAIRETIEQLGGLDLVLANAVCLSTLFALVFSWREGSRGL
jgi:hypothetical protein